MENASKALIMAGAILIALLIISISVIVFRNMSGAVDRNANMNNQKISAFNERIIPYIGENIGGSQVNALIQLVRSINQKAANDDDDTIHITLFFDNVDITAQLRNVQIGKYYKVTAETNQYGFLTEIRIQSQ